MQIISKAEPMSADDLLVEPRSLPKQVYLQSLQRKIGTQLSQSGCRDCQVSMEWSNTPTSIRSATDPDYVIVGTGKAGQQLTADVFVTINDDKAFARLILDDNTASLSTLAASELPPHIAVRLIVRLRKEFNDFDVPIVGRVVLGKSLLLRNPDMFAESRSTNTRIVEDLTDDIIALVQRICSPSNEDWGDSLRPKLIALLSPRFYNGQVLTAEMLEDLRLRIEKIEGRLGMPKEDRGPRTGAL